MMDVPAIRFRAIERPRVYPLGDDTPGLSPLTLYLAPAGMGKTVAVAQWARSDAAQGFDVRWLSLRDSEGAAGEFWEKLLGALGGPIQRYQGSARDHAKRRVRGLRTPTALVVDDFEVATQPQLDLHLAALLELNPHLHLIVMARHLAVLDGPLVTSGMSTQMLYAVDLAFTAEESQELARLTGLGHPEIARELHDLVQGWPIAVRLLAGELNGSSKRGDLEEHLAGLVTHQLMTLNDAVEHRILLLVALCSGIDIELLGELLSLSREDTEASVTRLGQLGLIRRSQKSDVTRLRCHQGFVAALQSRALELFGETQAQEFRLRTALDLVRHDPSRALQQLILLGELDKAALVLARHIFQVLDDASDLLPLLRQIEIETLCKHAMLLGTRLLLERADPRASVEDIERLGALLRESTLEQMLSPDQEKRLMALTLLVIAERLRGSGTTALRFASDLEQRLEENARRGVQVLERTLSLIYAVIASTGELSGDLRMARRARLRSVECAELRLDMAEQARGWEGLALVAALEGERLRAEEYLETANGLKAVLGQSSPHFDSIDVLVPRMLVERERGDVEALRRLLELFRPAAARSEYSSLVVTLEAALIRLEHGTFEALARLQNADIATPDALRPTAFSRAFITAYAAELYLCVGDYLSAERLIDGFPDRVPGERILHARALLFSGRNREAIGMLNEISEADLTPLFVVDSALIRAVAFWDEGEQQAAVEHFRTAAELVLLHGIRRQLTLLPYTVLCEISEAAGGVLDEVLAALPETVRCEPNELLTRAERRTLEALGEVGGTIAQVAESLFLSENTVKFHLRGIYRKLEVRGKKEALAKARRIGLIES